MTKQLVVTAEKCRGCRRCEVACSWQNGQINPRMAAVRIAKNEAEGRDRPLLSQQCLENFCGKEHPFRKGENLPVCAAVCLFGGIEMK